MATGQAHSDSQVATQCIQLEESLTDAHESLVALEKRLEVVLRPADDNAEEAQPEVKLVSHATFLRRIVDNVQGLTGDMNSLRDRIEI